MENLKFNNESQKEYFNSKKKEAVKLDGGIIKHFLSKNKTEPMDLVQDDANKENEEIRNKNYENIAFPDISLYEVDSETKSFINEYKEEVKKIIYDIKKSNRLSDFEKIDKWSYIESKLRNKIISLTNEKDKLWQEANKNDYYLDSSPSISKLKVDPINQIKRNIQELIKLQDSYDSNEETGFKENL